MYVLYNPMAGNGHGEEKAREIEKKVQGQKIEYRDVTRMDAADFLARLPMEETVVLAGGDGTLNHFINRYGSSVLNRPLYYFPAGSGNDFWNDVGQNSVDGMILLNDYLKNLPVVEVKGKKSWFLNGIGLRNRRLLLRDGRPNADAGERERQLCLHCYQGATVPF